MMSEPKKAPCIDVRTDVRKDERFAVLGDLAGYNRHEALGRMIDLWAWCRDRGLKDTRDELDGYVVSAAVVTRLLGPNGVVAILADGCDEFALAVQLDDGGLYLRGTSEYVAAARARASTSSAGGKARHENGPRDDAGRFVTEPTNVQPGTQPQASREPAGHPAAPQPTPASSSSLLPLPSSQGDPEKNSARPSGGGARPRPKPNDPTSAELESVRVVLEKLSAQNGVQYTGTKEHERLIVNQLRAGVAEIDLRAVIGYCADELGWKSKPDMAPYLRPETLFGPKNIARYLDPARTWFAKLRSSRTPRQQPQDGQGASA